MCIKKEILVEHHYLKTWGYVDLATDITISNKQDEATKALVLIVVGINANFKVPIA